jgi:Ni,Fe-hydrogenase III component G
MNFAAAKIIDELSQSNEKNDMKRDGIQNTKAILAESLKEKWENKVMHGQYIRSIDKQLISEEDTFLWLSKRDLKAETESEIVAAQDQALQTKYHATKILQTETDSKCRVCHQFEERVDHITSVYPILAKEQYIKRHDRVCAQLHFNICKELGAKLDSELWYEHVPKSVETSQVGKVTILWNQQIQTDRTIPNNKPGVIIRDNEKVTCMLIDVAIQGDRNVIKKEAEKIIKYKDLITGIERMWNVKTKVMPVIIGATGTISKSFRKHLSSVPGKHDMEELQKTAILGTYCGKC